MVTTTGAAADDWPFVGRTKERESILRALDRRGPTGVALFGPPGAGKTSLARAATSSFRATTDVRRSVCAADTQRIPLGSLAALLPGGIDEETSGRAGIIRLTIDTLSRTTVAHRGTAPPSAPILVVDDAHLLDELSAAVIQQGVASERMRVVLTARTDEPLPRSLTALLREGSVQRFDLGPLDRHTVQTLLVAALGGPVESLALRRLVAVSEGNALFLRELVLGCLDTGLLRLDGGLWRLHGPLASSARLGDLIEARLASVSPAEHDALEHLAVGEPLSVELLRAVSGSAATESLERRQLVRIEQDGRRQQVFFDHPLVGEVLRARLPELTRMRRSRQLADAASAIGTRRSDDLLRLARWRLDAGESLSGPVMLAAAKRAYASRDLALCERMAQAAWDAVGGVDAGLVLATALAEAGRSAMAEEVIDRLEPLADDDRSRSLVTMSRCIHVCFAGERLDEHPPAVRGATARMTDTAWIDELHSLEANFAACVADGARAVRIGLVHATSPTPRVRFAAGFGLGWGHLLAAQPDAAIRVARSMMATFDEIEDRRAVGTPGIFAIIEGMGHLLAGRLGGVQLIGEIGHHAELDDAHEDPVRRGWSALLLARTALHAGRLADAAQWAAESAVLLRDANHLGPRRWALGIRLYALAQCDDLEAADAARTELDAAGPAVVRLLASEDEQGRAWLSARHGDQREAVARLREFARASTARGAVAPAVAAIHDMVRLGATAQARDALTGVDIPPAWAVGRAVEDLIEGITANDDEALAAISQRFATMGLTLAAAEAAAFAAHAATKAGAPRRRPRHATRSAELAAACQQARTPALALASEATPLTAREREIAAAAAGGVSNAAIADRLGLSKRTVENHLQRVYTKLGATRREELPRLLDRTREVQDATNAGGS